ncbi:hypothetical protein BHE74_00020554 [Ensete ventricosum]|nr:hypothetical protein BHE74_00020554 [Ensete ventricosum]
MRFRQKSTVGGRLREKLTVGGRLSEKKGRRRRRGKRRRKKKRRRKNTYRPRTVLARAPSPPTGRGRFFSHVGRKIEATSMIHRLGFTGCVKWDTLLDI